MEVGTLNFFSTFGIKLPLSIALLASLSNCGEGNSQSSTVATTEEANVETIPAQKPWFGLWQCETFGPHSTGASIVIRIDKNGWRLMGNKENPFYHQASKQGSVGELSTPKDAWFIDLALEGLNSDPASGKWVSYKDDRRLGWISWGGEGSENPCDKIE